MSIANKLVLLYTCGKEGEIMSFYEELYRVRDEYNKFQRLERDYSTYSGSQVVTIFKTLLENYEGEEYNVLINDLNQLIALPSDKNSKSLKLKIGNLYNGDTFYKSMDLVLIFPYKIDKYINISSFQSDMQINYLEDFFTSLVEYRYSKDLSSIKDDKVVDILNEYIDTKGLLHVKEVSAGFRRTTNNRMEMMAVIAGLEALNRPCEVDVYSDSQYVVNAFNQHWIEGWKKRGWKRSGNKPVLNMDLWQRMLKAMELHQVRFHWVKGHAGHPENERCDFLATSAADGTDLLIDENLK